MKRIKTFRSALPMVVIIAALTGAQTASANDYRTNRADRMDRTERMDRTARYDANRDSRYDGRTFVGCNGFNDNSTSRNVIQKGGAHTPRMAGKAFPNNSCYPSLASTDRTVRYNTERDYRDNSTRRSY